MELDEKLRARLRALAVHEPELDERARARVRTAVLERARATDARRTLTWLLLPACAAMAVWLWLPGALRQLPDTLPPPRLATRAARPEAAPQLPACARAPSAPEAGRFSHAAEPRLELARARVVKTRASVLEVTTLDDCELGLVLEHGEVAVHARALRGGRLWIDTSFGRVRVRGTVFSVAQQADRLRIAVAEGAVAFEHGGSELAQAAANDVLQVDAGGAITRAALGARERARLLARLSLGVAPVQGEKPAGEPPNPAARPDAAASEERLWREGTVPAYAPEGRHEPSSLQPDGRPMKKPRLIE